MQQSLAMGVQVCRLSSEQVNPFGGLQLGPLDTKEVEFFLSMERTSLGVSHSDSALTVLCPVLPMMQLQG